MNDSFDWSFFLPLAGVALFFPWVLGALFVIWTIWYAGADALASWRESRSYWNSEEGRKAWAEAHPPIKGDTLAIVFLSSTAGLMVLTLLLIGAQEVLGWELPREVVKTALSGLMSVFIISGICFMGREYEREQEKKEKKRQRMIEEWTLAE